MTNGLEYLLAHDMDSVSRAMNREIQKALRIHKLLGNPIYIGGENGEVLTIQPEDILLNEELLNEE